MEKPEETRTYTKRKTEANQTANTKHVTGNKAIKYIEKIAVFGMLYVEYGYGRMVNYSERTLNLKGGRQPGDRDALVWCGDGSSKLMNGSEGKSRGVNKQGRKRKRQSQSLSLRGTEEPLEPCCG